MGHGPWFDSILESKIHVCAHRDRDRNLPSAPGQPVGLRHDFQLVHTSIGVIESGEIDSELVA